MKLDPKFESALTVQQYQTKESIEGVQIIDQPFHRDDTGNFTELGRINDQGELEAFEGFKPQQVSLSIMLPKVVKAFHVHKKQDDVWYVSPDNRLLAILVDLRENSPTKGNKCELFGGGRIAYSGYLQAWLMEPAILHTSTKLIYFTTQQFSPESPDEYRLPWDYFGADIWRKVEVNLKMAL